MRILKFKDLRIERLIFTILTLFTVYCLLCPLFARSLTRPPRSRRIWDKKWLDINRWRCPFYNDGRYAYDEATTDGAGRWPYPYENTYIFGAGPWVGAIIRGDTLVTVGYNPNTARGEFYPTPAKTWEQGTGDARDRIYKFPSDWPPPFDFNRYDTNLVPKKNFSLQDMWCVYCDLSPDYHTAPGRPLGIEVYQTIYAWNYTSNQDIFFIIYKVKNVSGDTLKRMILGACMDPDVGMYNDDMVGLIKELCLEGDTIPVQNVGYVGDYDNTEAPNPPYWQSGTPGVVAYKFLESPRKPDGTLIGMSAFKKFTIDIDPMKDVDQYKTLAGYDYRTGIYSPYDSIDVQPADKRFIQCTGPFDLAPDSVATIIVAAIAAPYGSAGELWNDRDTTDLKPLYKLAKEAQFIYDNNWLLPGPPVASNVTLIPMDNKIRIVWDDLPERTPDPYYTEVAGNPNSPGYDPAYREYDFEGYKIYKSTDGVNWELLAHCDLVNGIKFQIVTETIIRGDIKEVNTRIYADDTITQPGMVTKANDYRTFYSLEDKKVTNGFTYYYRVAGYDFNFQTKDTLTGRIDTISFESNPTPVSIKPRWEAPNYDTSFVKVIRVIGDTVNPGVKCSTVIVIPYAVTPETLRIRFAGPQYADLENRAVYQYTVDKDTTIAVISNNCTTYQRITKNVFGPFKFYYDIVEGAKKMRQKCPAIGGTELIFACSIPVPSKYFDTVYPTTGSYPKEVLYPIPGTVRRALWAFRGSDYKIKWKVINGKRTCEVYDLTNNVEVPKTRFINRTGNDSLANGWNFAVDFTLGPTSDTLEPTHKVIYICGGFIALNYDRVANVRQAIGNLIDSIQDGDEWYIKGHTGFGTSPYYNLFYLIGDRLEIDRTPNKYKLNVKVVPNPYIVTNAWETHQLERKIAFIKLPAECTIRIFTVAGDLVKVIHHKDTRTTKTSTEDKLQPMELGGTEYWNLLNEHDQLVSAGVYIFHIESDIGEQVGKFAIVR
ncbi:MAG: hypothetical protein ABIK61_06655 [candidate division WOR-3 bacterium]